GQGYNRLDDRSVAAVANFRTLHERTVNLDLAEETAAKISERRIACAEIVKGKANAEGLQASKILQSGRGFLQEHAFGDLKFDALGSDLARRQSVHDADRQTRILKLNR